MDYLQRNKGKGIDIDNWCAMIQTRIKRVIDGNKAENTQIVYVGIYDAVNCNMTNDSYFIIE